MFYHLETWAQAITTVTTKTGILKKCLEDKGFMDKGADDVFVHVRDNPDLSIDVVGQHCAIELVYDSWNCKQKGIHLTTEAPVFEPVTVPRIDPPTTEEAPCYGCNIPLVIYGTSQEEPRRNQEESPVSGPVNIDTRPKEPRRISRDKHFVFEASRAGIDRLRSIDKG